MNSKSQSATEFVVLAAFMLLVVFGFFAVTSSKILSTREDANQKIAQDIADLAYNEIETAKSLNDGYARTFVMPQDVNNVNYSISIIDNRELSVNYLGYEYVRFLPLNVIGNISKGLNSINKNKGVIYLKYAQPICGNNICEAGESCSSCISDCGACPSFRYFLMKNNILNVISFNVDGDIILKGTLQQNSNPQPTADDEFVFKDRNGNSVAIVNLATGNMGIKGILQQGQTTISPPQSGSNFVVKDSNGNVISYLDESGNFILKGSLTQLGNP